MAGNEAAGSAAAYTHLHDRRARESCIRAVADVQVFAVRWCCG